MTLPPNTGGLYDLTQASQGKDGSSMDAMSSAKLKVASQGRPCNVPLENVVLKKANF